MPRQCCRIAAGGFSLVEVLIGVMILGVGAVLIAAAFPVGLRYHQESVDDTVAGMLARTAVNRLTLMRTHDGHGEYYEADSGSRDFFGHLCIVECFEDSPRLQYLFDMGDGRHTGAAGRPGEVLKRQQLGDDIDEWLPKSERVFRENAQYGFQVFYRRIADPGSGGMDGSRTFMAFVVVQKSKSVDADPAWDGLPAPSRDGALTVASVSAGEQSITLDGDYDVLPGAMIVSVEDARWYSVVDVQGEKIYLSRNPSGLAGKAVRAINRAVAVFGAVVNKQFIR
jgi:prepilin-type N-terminal cleavage/methylation domain-containing protein